MLLEFVKWSGNNPEKAKKRLEDKLMHKRGMKELKGQYMDLFLKIRSK